jgi:hypothetical protein
MVVLVTLTSPGSDTGPFNLFSDVNLGTPLVSGVAKSALVSGYTLSSVPDAATYIKVLSTGTCTNFINLNIVNFTTTTTTTSNPTTTTTTTASGPTTTTTTTLAGPTTTTTSTTRLTTTTTSTTISGTTTTTTTPIPTTTTTTTSVPNYKFYFQVRNQTDTAYGNGTFTLNSTGGSVPITTDYSLVLSGASSYNPSGSSITASSGYVIDRITKYDYDGTTVLYNLSVGLSTYSFGTGPFTMNSTGTLVGQFQTIKVFTRPA